MSLFRDSSVAFDQRLRAVATVVELPPELAALKDRLAHWQRNPGINALDRLADAVIAGDPADGVMFAAALAETASTPPTHNAVVTGVRTRVQAAIRAEYRRHAHDIYGKVAALFDEQAAAFTAAAIVDPEAPAEAVLDLPAKAQAAWKSAGTISADLTSLVNPLAAAARLADIAHDDDHVLPLTVDATGVDDLRRLWTAWDVETAQTIAERRAANGSPFTESTPTRSRCGRWSALLDAGATLRACPPEDFQPIPRPNAMVPTPA